MPPCSSIDYFGEPWPNFAEAVRINRLNQVPRSAHLTISVCRGGLEVSGGGVTSEPPPGFFDSVKKAAEWIESGMDFPHAFHACTLRLNIIQEPLSVPSLIGEYSLGSGDVGDIRVAFSDVDGPSKVLAYAFAPSSNPNVIGNSGGDVVVDRSEDWNPELLQYVLAHELFHALGLGHSDDPGSLMYPTVTGTENLPTKMYPTDAQALYQRYTERAEVRTDFSDRVFLSGTRLPGRLRSVSLGTNGELVGVNRYGRIYAWEEGLSWRRFPGRLEQVSSGVSIWGTNKYHRIYTWHGGKWVRIPGRLSQVFCSPYVPVQVIGCNRHGNVYRRLGISQSNPLGNKWVRLPRPPYGARQAAVTKALNVLVLCKDDKVYEYAFSSWSLVATNTEKFTIEGTSIFLKKGTYWQRFCLLSRTLLPEKKK